MKKDNPFLRWLIRPHGLGLVGVYLLTVAIAVLSVLCAVWGIKNPIVYAVYALAAISLGYSVYTIVIYAPSLKHTVTAKVKENAFASNIMENYDFKTTVFSLLSFGLTVAFVVMNLVSAVRYRLIWYVAISAYYFVLMVLRGGILLAERHGRKKYEGDWSGYDRRKWQIYLAGGAILIVLELAMAAAVTQMMLSRRPMQKSEIMTITNAAYTFYKMTMTIFHLVKARRFRDPTVQALRNINFADACMSMVSLTVLMLYTFGESGQELIYLKAIVGFSACAAIIAVASIMIVRAKRNLQRIEGEKVNE